MPVCREPCDCMTAKACCPRWMLFSGSGRTPRNQQGSRPSPGRCHPACTKLRPCWSSLHRGAAIACALPGCPLPATNLSRACLLCSLAIELVAACCHACPHLISLHAAAVCLHGRTLIFCGDNRAGKSTLVTRLMADAARGLGDDLLGLHRGKIFSFGVAPRLRLPPPSSPALKRFMNERPGIRDRHYGYLAPSPDDLAPWGERHAPDAVILLERTPGSRAVLLPASAATGMDNVLARFLIPDGGAREVLQAGLATAGCPALPHPPL